MNWIKTGNKFQLDKFGLWTLLAFFLVLGAAIKSGFLFQGSLWPDEALYLYIARNLASDWTNLRDISGNVFYHNPPLLMYILSLLPNTSAVEFATAARTIIVLMATGTIVITFFIGKKIYHPFVGAIAAGFLAVCPLSNWISVRILTDIPVVFFIYLSICMLVYDKKAAFYFFGVCAVLTKYSAFPVLFLPFLLRFKTKTWAMIYAGVFFMLVGFIQVRNLLPPPAGWLKYFYYYFQYPDIFQMFSEAEFFLGYFLLAFFIIGIFFTIRDKKYSALFHWVVLFGLFRFFLPWLVFRISRYTLPLYPGLLILAAYGCYRTAQALTLRWPIYSRWIILFFVVALSGVLFLHTSKSIGILRQTGNTFIGYDQAGSFLKKQPEPRIVATASTRQLKYYLPDFVIHDIAPKISPERLKALLQEKNIRYLAIDLWSPHLPAWCRTYDYSLNGYTLIYGKQGVYIFILDK